MNSLFFLPITLVLGTLLGNLYFRGLWMTVQKLPTAQSPFLLTLGSFFGRLASTIARFALVLAIALISHYVATYYSIFRVIF